MVERSRSGRRGRSRRTLTPPPPTWPRGEAAIIRELPGPAGVVLWQCARDVRLWALTDASRRQGLFRVGAKLSEAVIDSELSPSISAFAELVRAPAMADPRNVALAAGEVARWAEHQGLVTTALEYAEAAAFADQESAEYSVWAGRLARDAGETNLAIAWFGRAIGLARGDHNASMRAQLAFGELMYSVGNYEAARRALRRASSLGVKYGRRGITAQANHQLLLTTTRLGKFDEGVAAAEKALERYPVRHPRLLELARAFTEHLIGNGYYSAAVTLLQQLALTAAHPERILHQGMLARCYGILGSAAAFAGTCDDVVQKVGVTGEGARALIDVAAGAEALGDREETAGRLAREAASIARSIGDDGLEADAADLLEALARGKGVNSVPGRDASVPLQVLVTGFLRRLEKRAAHTPSS